MSEINLHEILYNNSKHDRLNWDEALTAMKIACEKAIDLCADNADADYNIIYGKTFEEYTIEVYIIKQSILDVKKIIV